jgi:hypothetical protein
MNFEIVYAPSTPAMDIPVGPNTMAGTLFAIARSTTDFPVPAAPYTAYDLPGFSIIFRTTVCCSIDSIHPDTSSYIRPAMAHTYVYTVHRELREALREFTVDPVRCTDEYVLEIKSIAGAILSRCIYAIMPLTQVNCGFFGMWCPERAIGAIAVTSCGNAYLINVETSDRTYISGPLDKHTPGR